MKKLTQRDRNNIIYRHKRRESAASLAQRYGVSERMIYKILKEYHETGCVPKEKKAGRKNTKLTVAEESLILACFDECYLGAVGLETYIENTRGIHIPHNKIHSYLLATHNASECARKKRQRKYCRYERNHSMTIWHTDWKEFYQEGERKYLTVYIDDHSRFITCYGVFDMMTTENSIAVLQMGINEYGCPEEIVTDNGSQYCTMRRGEPYNHAFGRFLIEHGIKHIRSRVSHPQTNGKVERFFREVDQRLGRMKTIEAVIYWQNYIKPHKSLEGKTPGEVFWYSFKPERILNYVNSWFWAACDGCDSESDKY